MKAREQLRREPLGGGLWIIQDHRLPCFTEDAVLLADFAATSAFARAADLCCGNGIVPLLLAARCPKGQICGLELLPPVADMARRSVALNGLQERIEIVTGDVCMAGKIWSEKSFDLVTANPPYNVRGCGRISADPLKAAARSELYCTLADVVREAARLLATGGRFVLVQRYARLAETLDLCRSYDLAAVRWRPVRSYAQKERHLFLLAAQKGAAASEQQLPELVVRRDDGAYTKEAAAIFAGGGAADE